MDDGPLSTPFTIERYLREVTLPVLERGLAKSGPAREAFQILTLEWYPPAAPMSSGRRRWTTCGPDGPFIGQRPHTVACSNCTAGENYSGS